VAKKSQLIERTLKILEGDVEGATKKKQKRGRSSSRDKSKEEKSKEEKSKEEKSEDDTNKKRKKND